MNTKENRAIYLFIIALINVLAIISGIYVGMSDILTNSRYGFITIIFASATIADCFIINYRDGKLYDEFYQKFSNAKEEAEKCKDKLIEITEERDLLKSQLEHYTSGDFEEDYNSLKKKCESIETFRNAFPCKISDEYIVYNIMRTNLQIGKASTWQIVGYYNGDLWEINIVRSDKQSYKELLSLITSTTEPDNISELNQSETLLWE